MKILAVIPARGGSKGVPKKNMRLVGGSPLIAHTIAAAAQSRLLTHFVTSTDDAAIARVARRYHCPVIKRPAELAQDQSPMIPVLLHALEQVEQEGVCFDYIVVLQPTCPLRTAADIDTALSLLIKSKADSLISVYQVADCHPARMYTVRQGLLSPFLQKTSFQVRQKLPAVYHRNGAIYAVKRDLLLKDKTLFGRKTIPYVMPREVSVNIDDELDLKLADLILTGRKTCR